MSWSAWTSSDCDLIMLVGWLSVDCFTFHPDGTFVLVTVAVLLTLMVNEFVVILIQLSCDSPLVIDFLTSRLTFQTKY
jgi:hypothetical protein